MSIIDIIALRDSKMIKNLKDQLDISNDIVSDLMAYVSRLEARITELEPVEEEEEEEEEQEEVEEVIIDDDDYKYDLGEMVYVNNYYGLTGKIRNRRTDSKGTKQYTILFLDETFTTFREKCLESYDLEDKITDQLADMEEECEREGDEFDYDECYEMIRYELERDQRRRLEERDDFLYPEEKARREAEELKNELEAKAIRKENERLRKIVKEEEKALKKKETELKETETEPPKKTKKAPPKKKTEKVIKMDIVYLNDSNNDSIYDNGFNSAEDEQDRLDLIAEREAERLEHIQAQKEFDEREQKEIDKINRKIAKNKKTAKKIN